MGYLQALVRDCITEHNREGRKYYKEALIHIKLRREAIKILRHNAKSKAIQAKRRTEND